MAALLIACILIEDARSSRLALSQSSHGQIAQLFFNEPLAKFLNAGVAWLSRVIDPLPKAYPVNLV